MGHAVMSMFATMHPRAFLFALGPLGAQYTGEEQLCGVGDEVIQQKTQVRIDAAGVWRPRMDVSI